MYVPLYDSAKLAQLDVAVHAGSARHRRSTPHSRHPVPYRREQVVPPEPFQEAEMNFSPGVPENAVYPANRQCSCLNPVQEMYILEKSSAKGKEEYIIK